MGRYRGPGVMESWVRWGAVCAGELDVMGSWCDEQLLRVGCNRDLGVMVSY